MAGGYTLEQMKSPETLAQTLSRIPDSEREQVTVMANAFLLGVEAQQAARMAANASDDTLRAISEQSEQED